MHIKVKNKPILFNTEMVKAILEGKKTVTRRIKKSDKPPYQVGDILYTRETWQHVCDAGYVYKATDPDWETTEDWKWRPSIHMPKEAARIFLQVTDVRVERLQEMTVRDLIAEGAAYHFDVPCRISEKFDAFKDLWDSTIKKEALEHYGWDANPWVWAIEFKKL